MIWCPYCLPEKPEDWHRRDSADVNELAVERKALGFE